MTISVFTPTNATDYTHLQELYGSLCKQTKLPTQWVVLINGPAAENPPVFDDPLFEITIEKAPQSGNIGALKKAACNLCFGDIMVEVDHDDLLTPDAIAEIETAFLTHKHVNFVYSDAFEFKPDGTANLYDGRYGWQHRDDGHGTAKV